MASVAIDQVLRLIRAAEFGSPTMVAIDGMSAAGKSTLATEVAAALPDVELVRGDDFYRVMDDDQRFHLTPDQGYHQDFDWQRLLHEVLMPLRAGNSARFQRYDWSSGQLGEWMEARPAAVVIAEGVYMSRPEFRSVFDLAVWVETSPEIRAVRQSRRDDSPEWVDRWDRAERFYVEHFTPHVAVDLTVEGTPT